jgi:transcriptional regulator with XRE-family HTH domain
MKPKNQNKPKKDQGIDNFTLPERLKYLRGLRDLSQEQLAKISGVSQSTIAQIESGRKDPSISTLKKICKAINVQMAVLFAGDDIHVFDMKRLRDRYKSAEELNPTLYKAVGEIVRFAKDIGFIN